MQEKACPAMDSGSKVQVNNTQQTRSFQEAKVKSTGLRCATQFELSKITLKNLGSFKLSPTAKLVLLALVDCYNPNKKDFYPSQQTMATNLGIGISSVKRAIKELTAQGIVIYETKKVNRYKLTSKFFGTFKLIPVPYQTDTSTGTNLNPKQIKEKNKKQRSQSDPLNLNKYQKRKYHHDTQVKGMCYKPFKADKIKRDDRTPMNDKKTALKYISELENSLDNPIIKTQVDKIKKRWNF